MTSSGRPFHSQHSRVYHEYDDCPVSRGIPAGERLDGTGGTPLCGQCKRRAEGKPFDTFGHGDQL